MDTRCPISPLGTGRSWSKWHNAPRAAAVTRTALAGRLLQIPDRRQRERGVTAIQLLVILVPVIFGLMGDHKEKILIYYLAFVLVDFIVGIIAFRMEKESYKKLLYIIPQRLIWRQLMYYVLFKSIRRAVKGELSGWGVLKRTGNVKEI